MSPLVVHRKYRAGMVVLFLGDRWEIDAVEFWASGERLQLRALDPDRRVKSYEAWAHQVEFTGELVGAAA